MYNTTKNYKDLIYLSQTRHELKIYVDNQEIDDSKIIGFDSNYELFSNKKIELGSTPIQEITIELYKGALPEEYSEFYIQGGIFNGEIVPTGYFYVTDINDENDKKTIIKLQDKMSKFDIDYDGSKLIPCTLKRLLQDICNYVGVELGTENFIGEDFIIAVYDSTLSARTYLSYIAEQAGGFAHIGRDGKLYIKTINSNRKYGSNVVFNTTEETKGNISYINGKTIIDSGVIENVKEKIEVEHSHVDSVYNLMNTITTEYTMDGKLVFNIPKELEGKINFSIDENNELNIDVAEELGNVTTFSITEGKDLIIRILQENDIKLESNIFEIDLKNIELNSVGDVTDKLIYDTINSCFKIKINIGVISSYNGESITTDYISTSEGLDIGATIFYVLENPEYLTISEEQAQSMNLYSLLNFDLYNGKNRIQMSSNNISVNFMVLSDDMIKIPSEKLAEYVFSKEPILYTRVRYSDGIRNYEIGDKTGSTLYINSENMFIVDEKQIQNIYESISGLELYGFKGKTIIDPAIDIGDICYIDDKPFIYQGKITYSGKNIANISSQIKVQTEEESSCTKVNQKAQIRRIQSEINQIDGTIRLLGQEVSDNSQKTATMQLKVDEISLKVDDLEELSNEIMGVDPIILTNCKEGNLLELHIRGNNNVFYQQYPNNKLYPSNTLYPYKGSSLLKVYSDKLNSKFKTITSHYYTSEFSYQSDITKVYSGVYKGNDEYTITYLEINPNTTYIVRVKDESIPHNAYFSVSTFGDEIFEELESATKTAIAGNIFKTNASRDTNGWYKDTSIVEHRITTGPNDKYLFLRYSNGSISNLVAYENFEIIDLAIINTLKKSGDYYDEYVIKDGYGYELRRVLDNGIIVENPEPTNKKALSIPLAEGTNTIDIINYTAIITAKYVIQNNLTNFFATKIELSSQILQKSNEIKLSVIEEITDENYLKRATIESSIDLGILDDQGYIKMKTNKFSWTSDNSSLTPDGHITLTAGTIAGFDMWTDKSGSSIRSWLTKDFTNNGTTYRSGLLIRDDYYSDFIFAGMPITSSGWNTVDASFRIIQNGTVYCKQINMNGESGYTKINFDSGRTAMQLTSTQLDFRIDNSTNNLFARFERKTEGFYLYLQDAPFYCIYDNLHGRLAYQVQLNSGARQEHFFRGQMWKNYADDGGTYYAVVDEASSSSDRKLKHNIKDSNTNALNIIKQIKFRQFDWNENTPYSNKHINIGVIAQEVMEIDTNYVTETSRMIAGEEEKIYNMHELNLITTAMKAIQELSCKIEDLEKKVG